MRNLARAIAAAAWVLLLPSMAWAQASIAGVVRDQSGGVLPGVTVEVSSPALIEKARTAVSDSSGQYRVIDLRPGTYSVVFTISGFNQFRRDGIELTGALTATVNADLRVGDLQETVTVTGETPIVDVQSVRRQTTLDNEILTTVPTARSWAATDSSKMNLTSGTRRKESRSASRWRTKPDARSSAFWVFLRSAASPMMVQ